MATVQEIYMSACRCFQAGDLRQADALCRQIRQADPSFVDAVQMLGLIALEAGKPELSLKFLHETIAMAPGKESGHYNLGMIYHRLSRLEDAEACYRRAMQANASYAEAYSGLAAILKVKGDLAGAEAMCITSLRLKPVNADGWNALGTIRQQQGRFQEALDHFRTAIACNPRHAFAHNNLAVTLQRLGDLEAAMIGYRQSIELNPANPSAHANLGIVLHKCGKLDEAETQLREAIRLSPGFAGAFNNLGSVLTGLGKLTEAIACFRKAEALGGGDAPAASNALLCMNYLPGISNAELAAEHRRWAQCYGKATSFGPRPDHDRDPDRPLRIGYISSDLRRHVMENFISPVFDHHDRQNVEIFCYAEVTAIDAVSERYKSRSKGWRSTVAVSDSDVAEMIRADQIDILVDLTGHTGESRLRVLAHKPAPVQMTWLGYPNTTGLTTIDYCLTDAIVDPPGAEAFYAESLLRLPECFCCYEHLAADPGVSPLPADRDGIVTFGSLHTLQRLNAAVLETWRQVLLATPNSRLMILRDSLRGRVRDEIYQFFTSRGIPSSRLDLRHGIDGGEYMRCYHSIDILLDTFPWSGHTTACQSLWLGVPVITLLGERHAGRMVASVMSAAGLSNLVAPTIGQYVKIAAKLAEDRGALALLRAGLRRKMAASAVCDAAGFTRNLEAAYRQAWRQWIGVSQSPA